MTEDRAIVTIERWIGCDYQTAKMIFNGVWLWHGDYYSAYIVNGDELEICKDGIPIHRIGTI